MADVVFPAPRLLAVDPVLPTLALRELRDYMAALALSRDSSCEAVADGAQRSTAFAAAIATADVQLSRIVALLHGSVD